MTHTAPGGGLGAPRFRGALPSNLYPDRRRFLHGQLEAGIFWKSSVYLKENRSYLLPPVKYYGNMSANNLLCVICSNANKQQLDTSRGEFLCGYSGIITHGLHQLAELEKNTHSGSPRLQEIPLT